MNKENLELGYAEKYYADLLSDVLSVITKPSVMVVGPLATDTNKFEVNLNKFRLAQSMISEEFLFDQVDYLDIYLQDSPMNFALKFGIFYQGLIKSGKISKIYVMSGYEDSEGTISEIKYAQEAGIIIEYLDSDSHPS